MTPLNEFKQFLSDNHNMSEEDMVTLRDLMDVQADTILDSYLDNKALNKNK